MSRSLGTGCRSARTRPAHCHDLDHAIDERIRELLKIFSSLGGYDDRCHIDAARTTALVRTNDHRYEGRRDLLQDGGRLDTDAVRRFASALHDLQSKRRDPRRWAHDDAPGDEGAAVLVDVRGGAEIGRSRRPDQEARRQRMFPGYRGADRWPHADDEGPAGRRLLHLRAVA